MAYFLRNVVQAGIAIFIALAAIVSFFTTLMIPLWPSRTQPVVAHFYQGRMRVFWFQSSGDRLAVSLLNEAGPDIRIEPYFRWPSLPGWAYGADYPRWVRSVRVGGIRTSPAWGAAWRVPLRARAFGAPPAHSSFVRMPAWAPSALLLFGPIRAVVRGVRKRQRKRNNLCENCGYHLFALTIPRCPECGQSVLPAA
jgi:hypothetical protein